MTHDPKTTDEEDPFDALFTGKLMPPVVMDEADDPETETEE